MKEEKEPLEVGRFGWVYSPTRSDYPEGLAVGTLVKILAFCGQSAGFRETHYAVVMDKDERHFTIATASLEMRRRYRFQDTPEFTLPERHPRVQAMLRSELEREEHALQKLQRRVEYLRWKMTRSTENPCPPPVTPPVTMLRLLAGGVSDRERDDEEDLEDFPR